MTDDQRFMLLPASTGDSKNQLIAGLEPIVLRPRGSTGTTVPAGSSTISFDAPENAVLVFTPHDRFLIQCALEKSTDSGKTWANVTADDVKEVLLVPNFLAHAFSAIKLMCNYKHCKVDGILEHGLGLWSDFLLSH